MKFIYFYIALLAVVSCDQWAVILVGSYCYWNYRHQADACHSYQLHKAHGIPEDHIILISYDDIANDPNNVLRGHLYNQPGENPPDVYEGCKATYRMKDVNPTVYKAVLTGDADTIRNVTGIKDPVVLKSTEEDTVFLSFFDHGAPDVLCFPDLDDDFKSKDLMNIFRIMQNKKMYKKIVYYMEACYSGSMFAEMRDNMNIYAVTASNAEESSWAAYCDEIVKGQYIDTCLGDLFSVVWMEDTDLNKKDENLKDQWKVILKGTDMSHPQQFGDLKWLNESIWDFIGNGNNSNRKSLRGEVRNPRIKSYSRAVKSQDVYMTFLKNKLTESKNEKERSKFLSMFNEEENYRRVTDNRFNLLVNKVTGGNERMKSKILNSGPSYSANKECYYELIEARKNYCGKTREYTLKYYPVLMNLCDFSDGKSSSIIDSMKEVCRSLPY